MKEWKELDVVPTTTGLARNPGDDILTLCVSFSSILRSDRLRKKAEIGLFSFGDVSGRASTGWFL